MAEYRAAGSAGLGGTVGAAGLDDPTVKVATATLRCAPSLSATGYVGGAPARGTTVMAATTGGGGTVVATIGTGGALKAQAFTRGLGVLAAQVVRVATGVAAASGGQGSLLPSSAAAAFPAATAALSATGYTSVQHRFGRSDLSAFGSSTGRQAATTAATGTLAGQAAATAVGVLATGEARGGNGVAAAMFGGGRLLAQTDHRAALVQAVALAATGSAEVQVVEALSAVASTTYQQAQTVITRVGAALVEVAGVLAAAGFEAVALRTGEDAITAVLEAAQNPADVLSATADLLQEVYLAATSSRWLEQGDLTSGITAAFDASDLAFATGTARPMRAKAFLISAGFGGGVAKATAIIATASAVVSEASVVATPAKVSGTLKGDSALAVTSYLSQPPGRANMQGATRMDVDYVYRDQVAGTAQPYVNSRMDLDQLRGNVGEAPTVGSGQGATTLHQVVGMSVRYSLGGQGHTVLMSGARVRCEVTGINVLVGDTLSTIHLRGDSTLTVRAQLLSLLLVVYGEAYPLAQALLAVAAPYATPTTAVAVTLSARVSLRGEGSTPDTAFRGSGTVTMPVRAAVVAAGRVAEGTILRYDGQAWLTCRTATVIPGPMVYGGPGRAAVTSAASLSADSRAVNNPLVGTAALHGGSSAAAWGAQRVQVAAVARATVKGEGSIRTTAPGDARLAAACTLTAGGTTPPTASGTAGLSAGGALEGAAWSLDLAPVAGEAVLAAAAALVPALPTHYAGAALRGTSRLVWTVPGHPRRLTATCRVRVRGGEGLAVHSGSAVVVAPPLSGRTQARGHTSRSAPRGTLTASATAVAAPAEALRVGSFSGNTTESGAAP